MSLLRKKIAFLWAVICLIKVADAQVCGTAGADGTTNISSSINTYYPAAANVTLAAGTQSIALSGVPVTDAYGNSFGTIPISKGDLLIIIQMQDATINFTNTTSYGSGNPTSGADGLGATGNTSPGNSGRFEYVIATSNVPLTGGTLTLKGSGVGNGTVYTYVNADPTTTSGKKSFQVIRIPQYANLRLSSNISPPPFNGYAGGIIAFKVAGSMDFNGYTINVSGKGFRGGYSLKKQAVTNLNNLYVTNATDDRASGKGEGIAGTPRYMWDGYNAIDNIIEGLPGGSAGRGAPANAGGGGNDTNAGGGGGGNGGDGGVGGNGYEPFGGTYPSGGRPGSINYLGSPDATRLVMGGGGGGGHANDANNGIKGGVGGGIVIIDAGSIMGTGTILANGSNGMPGVFNVNPDGSGGGGAGGTVFIKLSNPNPASNLTIQANGGLGGNTEGDPGASGVQSHGPGGGGGGGQVFYTTTSGTMNVEVLAGASGKTNSGNGVPHGAEAGRPGTSSTFSIASLPFYLNKQEAVCVPELTTDMSVLNPSLTRGVNDLVTYVVKLSNASAGGNASGVQANITLPSGFVFQSATVVYTGAAGGPVTITNQGTDTNPLLGDFNIPAGDVVTLNVIVKIDCTATGTYNSSAEALYLDPTRTFADPNRRITSLTNAFTGANTTYQSGGYVPGSNYNGLNSSAEDVIVVNVAITNNTITAPVSAGFCAGATPATIIGSTPNGGVGTFNYQWQSSTDNVTFTDITGATLKDFIAPVSNVNVYYQRVVSTGNCAVPQISNSVLINGSSNISSSTITGGATTTFCVSGDPALITGNTPTGGNGVYTYQWQSSTDNITFTDIPGATAKDYDPTTITATTYYRRTAFSGTCSEQSNVVSITVFALATITNNNITLPATSSFCTSGDAAPITGSAAAGSNTITYQWQNSPDGVNFTDISGATLIDYDPPVITNTTYYRRIASSGTCNVPSISNIVIISVSSPPVATTSNDVSICVNSSTVLNATGGTTYQWVPSTGLSDPNIANPIASPLTTTTYIVVVGNNNCTATASVTVTVIPKPTVNAGADQTILSGNKAQLNATVTGSNLQYKWLPVTYLDDPTIPNPVASPPHDITYTLYVTSQQGCFTVSDDVAIKVNANIKPTNTITPNGDGINDVWNIAGLNTYPSCVVNIFNRYGKSIFNSVGYVKAWDGKYNNAVVPSGTYYYTIDLKNGSKVISGWIAVIK